MIRRIYRAVFPCKPSEENLLIEAAQKAPRYTHWEFHYRDLKFSVSDFISVAYQVNEYFKEERLRFESDNANPVIIDCGANVGVSVLYFKRLYPNSIIEAFEPDPAIASYLKKNLLANKVENVNLHQKAIWKDDKGVDFGVEGADGGSVFLKGKKSMRVETVRLKDILSLYKDIDLLKIDIEGAEVEVIKDCNEDLKKVKYLFIEYHSWVSNKQELDELLSTLTVNGFRYYMHSVGAQTLKPFLKVDPYNGMDLQLDIYAVNTEKK